MLRKREGCTVMVYMFIVGITMAEDSDVRIGFHTSKVRERPKKMVLKCVPVTRLTWRVPQTLHVLPCS